MGFMTTQTNSAHVRQIRYPLILFLFVMALSFIMTKKMLLAWEHRLSSGIRPFSGTVIDAGTGVPAHREKGRWQIVRLADGVPVMLWMNKPVRLGDRIAGVASFKCGEGMRNPGGLSTRLWLWVQGVAHSGRLIRCEVEPVDHYSWTIRRLPDAFRDRVRFHLSSFWDSTSGGALLASLTLGDSALLSDVEQHNLRVSGLSHLTSVSGTHLYFFLAPFHMMTDRLRRTRRSRQRIMLVLTLVPGVVCGWKSGIARACLSVFMVRLDVIFGRQRDTINTLLTVATCLLLCNPFVVRSQAFWMSLAAAGTIRFVLTAISGQREWILRDHKDRGDDLVAEQSIPLRIGRFFRRAAYEMKRALLISFTAQVAVLPYLLMTSAGFQMLSPCVNTIAIPIASVLTASTYVMMTLLAVIPVGGRLVVSVGALFASLLEPATKLFHRLAQLAASIRVAYIPVEQFAYLVTFVLLGYLLFHGGLRSLILRRVTVVVVAAGILVSTLWLTMRGREWRVIFLDVDQGDATLIISPEGYTCLVDGGDAGYGFNTILPVLRLHSLGKIDLAIVTHAHSDHASGVVELLECGLVDRLCLPITSHRSPCQSCHDVWENDLTERLLTSAREVGVAPLILRAGDRLELGSLSFDVCYPEEERDNRDLNDDSLVLLFELGDYKILFTGDLTEIGEQQLLNRSMDLSADVLHVPHHGSKSSSSLPFLESVSPSISIVSVGRDNRFSHPHTCVLERLRDIGSDVYRTDRSGALILNIREGKGTMTEWITTCTRGAR